MSRWIAALLVQVTLGEFLNSPVDTEDGRCFTSIETGIAPAQALLQKGTRISDSGPHNFVALQMLAHSGQATRSETHFLEGSEGAALQEREEKKVGKLRHEPLSEEGYQNVAATCCNYNMEEYTRRLILDIRLGSLASLIVTRE